MPNDVLIWWDVTRPCVRRDSFVSVTWLTHGVYKLTATIAGRMRNAMFHVYPRRDSFCTCDMTHAWCVRVRVCVDSHDSWHDAECYVSCICETWLILSMRDMTHSWCVCVNSHNCRMCETWFTHMGWLRLVGSLKSQVSFAKETYKREDLL